MSDRKEAQNRWGPEDYRHIGPVYVRKQVIPLLLIVCSAAVLLIFGLPFHMPDHEDEQPPAYRYNDPKLAGVSGLVRVLDAAGRVRYVGEVAAGAYTGRGKVFNAAGELVYDGPLADGVYEGPDAKVYQDGVLVYTGEMSGNLYEGQGRRLSPATGIVSEGQFSRGLLEGRGREFYAGGALLREGTFSQDVLEGEGAEYNEDQTLLREGTFSAGLLHGAGREYTASGKLQYEGEFWRGVYHGQGTLYNTLLGVRRVEGAFSYGRLTGQGAIYHPNGQLLYTGLVCGERPRADAFLGLPLTEVETAFTAHWHLYSCEGITAFVYPYFSLMFITESPVALASPAQTAEESRQERQELLDALKPHEPEDAANVLGAAYDAPAGAAQTPPLCYDDELFSPDTDKREIVITQVLSYGQPLPCCAQPEHGSISGRHRPGWREWFSDFAAGRSSPGVHVSRTGQFIWRFTPQAGMGQDKYIGELLAEYAGVETMTVRKEDKDDMLLWYQTAKWGDGP